MKRNVTMKDIAKYAGVSTATVSYVLNKHPGQTISAETAEKVMSVVEQLNYVPNNSAKSLRKQQTGCIGVALGKNLTTPRVASTLQGIRIELEQNGYTILLCPLDGNEKNPEYIRFYRERKIDGIIYLGYEGRGILEICRDQILRDQIPMVILGTEFTDQISTVEYDYYEGARQHITYLLEKGVKRIFYLYPEMDIHQENERLHGVRDVIQNNPQVPLIEVKIPYSFEELDRHDKEGTGGLDGAVSRIGRRIRKSIKPWLEENLGFQESDGVVCSWGAWTEIVFLACLNRSAMPYIAGLASGNMFAESHEKISYTHLPSYEAGIACADLVLWQVQMGFCQEHLLLKPEMQQSEEKQQIFE